MSAAKLLPRRTLQVLLLFMATFHSGHVEALYQSYCSNENTGADYGAVYYQFMSNGYCQTQCKEEYAFAVVQYQDCWCSNYIPANQLDVSECDTTCPGFGSEQCGNSDQGLFGYVALTVSPSGTAGADSASASTSYSSSESSTSYSYSSQTPSTTYYSQTSSSYDYTSDSTTSTTPSSTSTSTPPSSTSVAVIATTAIAYTTAQPTSVHTVTPRPVTSTQVVTISGAIVTQTVTSTPAPFASSDTITATHPKKNVSGGVIAGAVIGALAGLALIAAGVILFLRRRNNKDGSNQGRSHKGMMRTASVLSKVGLISSTRAADTEKSLDDPVPASAGQGSQRHSTMFGAMPAHEANESPTGTAEGVYESGHESRRNSRPLVYDQRLNPAALMQNWEMNGSRTSVNTMQDQRDYSRPLNVTNPDPYD